MHRDLEHELRKQLRTILQNQDAAISGLLFGIGGAAIVHTASIFDQTPPPQNTLEYLIMAGTGVILVVALADYFIEKVKEYRLKTKVNNYSSESIIKNEQKI